MTTHFSVNGFDAAGIVAGIKKNGARDLALIASQTPCRAAALFTQNAFPAAPVIFDKQLLAFNAEQIHAVVINAGNANACTGAPGIANARRSAEAAAHALGAHDHAVLVMSTGVIGQQLPVDKLVDALPRAVEQLRPDGWSDAAQAVMTTDTRPKLAMRTLELNGATVTLVGIAKGAGMIHPNMATMLSVVCTDAAIAQPLLHEALVAATAQSFNRISIDGDTSTNDTILLLANGAAGNAELVDGQSSGLADFTRTLTDLCIELAQANVRDGEGVTKFVTVQVNGARSDAEAHVAANTVATSPLVKTAFYGNDANWGRILAALGRSGAQVTPDLCDLIIAGGDAELQLVHAGTPTPFAEKDSSAIFAQPEVVVRIELGLGEGSATVWTCDLSHDYVSINADYRT